LLQLTWEYVKQYSSLSLLSAKLKKIQLIYFYFSDPETKYLRVKLIYKKEKKASTNKMSMTKLYFFEKYWN
jgi:hypothetical protein